ncbi:hypothetical protein [Photorhabdus luminescens]|uniref:Uncharacterized protein n=1 Tax=Photorhabdus luminescens subsp. sonorensis TaxID=1173677 RepID=A0A5C4RI68_PHOLU|nr:hypothetical protein [Photorhabdus luminescens]TNH43772.1 hypothetical protein EP164_09495 [Photorhabdus luminescens subsp. sonorensis]
MKNKYLNGVDDVIRGKKDYKRWPTIKRAFRYLIWAIFGSQESVSYVGCVFYLGIVLTLIKHGEFKKERDNEKTSKAEM